MKQSGLMQRLEKRQSKDEDEDEKGDGKADEGQRKDFQTAEQLDGDVPDERIADEDHDQGIEGEGDLVHEKLHRQDGGGMGAFDVLFGEGVGLDEHGARLVDAADEAPDDRVDKTLAETIATIVKPGEEGQDDAIEDGGGETGQSQGQEEREKVDLSKEGEGSDWVVLEDVIDGKYRDDKDDQDFDDVFAGLLFHQSLWMTSFILRRISSAPRIFSVS